MFFYFYVMETTYADSWSDSQPCDIDMWVNKWRSAWPIFQSSVILPYICKTIWCMNIILWDYDSVMTRFWPQNECRSLWSIFHGPLILPYILKTDVWMSYFVMSGWLGRAMVLGSFQCQGVLLLWHMIGQGPAVLAADAGRVGCFFFHLVYPIFLF